MRVERLRRIYSYLAVGLAVGQCVLVIVSWLLSAMMTGGVRSLLSGQGVRWFLGSLTSMLASPLLVWLLLLSMAVGSLWQSGLLALPLRLRRERSLPIKERVALTISMLLLLLLITVVVALTSLPHAPLLSATGQLFPSAFSRAIVPLLAFAVIIVSLSFGMLSGGFRNVTDAICSLSYGIVKVAPLIVLYMLAILFYETLRFVLVLI